MLNFNKIVPNQLIVTALPWGELRQQYARKMLNCTSYSNCQAKDIFYSYMSFHANNWPDKIWGNILLTFSNLQGLVTALEKLKGGFSTFTKTYLWYCLCQLWVWSSHCLKKSICLIIADSGMISEIIEAYSFIYYTCFLKILFSWTQVSCTTTSKRKWMYFCPRNKTS